MESKCFAKLYQYFTSVNSIVYKHEKPYVDVIYNKIPLPEFRNYSFNKASDFIGEYNRNLEKYKNKQDFVIREFQNFKYKFSTAFYLNFNFDFDDPNKLFNLDIFPKDELNADLETAMKIKWEVFHFVINYINKEVDKQHKTNENALKKTRKKRRERENHEFDFAISNKLLAEIYEILLKRNYIAEDSDQIDFIDIFKGRQFKNPIKWLKTNYLLKYFISGVNKLFGNKLHDGIWDLTVRRFVDKDGNVFPKNSLMKASKTKNGNMDFIDHILYLIQDEINHKNEN